MRTNSLRWWFKVTKRFNAAIVLHVFLKLEDTFCHLEIQELETLAKLHHNTHYTINFANKRSELVVQDYQTFRWRCHSGCDLQIRGPSGPFPISARTRKFGLMKVSHDTEMWPRNSLVWLPPRLPNVSVALSLLDTVFKLEDLLSQF